MWYLRTLLPVLVVLLVGCATPLPRENPAAAPPDASGGLYWWYVKFRLHWPKDQEPPWHPDLLLAHRVVAPVLADEGDAIALWRFHRRAAPDAAGRQFSFIFRATPATAARINARIAADPLLGQLQRQGVVEALLVDDPAAPTRPGIGDTSDPNWSLEMREAWPAYIMGVSTLWLDLIARVEANGHWPRAPLARYRAIAAELDRRWREEGGHALLHHLSAVFGYRELEVTTRGALRF